MKKMKSGGTSKRPMLNLHFEGAPSAKDFNHEANERYKKEYGFQKSGTGRSPVGNYEKKAIETGNFYGAVGKTEKNLVMGNPHGFSGRRGDSIYGKGKGLKFIK